MPQKITTPNYEGPERRMDENRHDAICDRRITWMRAAIFMIIGTVLIGTGFGYTQNENMKQVNATQGVEINHNTQEIEKLEEKFDIHLREQRDVNEKILETLNSLKTDVTVIKRKVE